MIRIGQSWRKKTAYAYQNHEIKLRVRSNFQTDTISVFEFT